MGKRTVIWKGRTMIRPIITLRRKRIVVDVDTQKDFFLAKGKACIRNHRRVLANVRRVVAWARVKNVRMISTSQVYNGANPEKDYCIAGTEGQEKIPYTIRTKHISFAADGSTDLDRDILKNYDQVILDKRCPNPFSEPRAERMLTELRASEFVLFGATIEGAVKATALGLLVRRKNVTILVDACGCHDRSAAEVALRQMEAKGAKLAEAKALLGSTCLRLVGICDCDRCQGKMQKTSFELSA